MSSRVAETFDRLLDIAAYAATIGDWHTVASASKRVLTADPDNDDARALSDLAKEPRLARFLAAPFGWFIALLLTVGALFLSLWLMFEIWPEDLRTLDGQQAGVGWGMARGFWIFGPDDLDLTAGGHLMAFAGLTGVLGAAVQSIANHTKLAIGGSGEREAGSVMASRLVMGGFAAIIVGVAIREAVVGGDDVIRPFGLLLTGSLAGLTAEATLGALVNLGQRANRALGESTAPTDAASAPDATDNGVEG